MAAYQQYAPDIGEEFWADYRADLADVAARAERGQVLVAETDGRLVGAVSYYPARPADDGPDLWIPPGLAYLRALAVDAGARGRGVGRLLAAACIELARSAGAPGIALDTLSAMPVAQAMYERLGFVRQPGDRQMREGLWLVRYIHSLTRDAQAATPPPHPGTPTAAGCLPATRSPRSWT